MTAHTPGPWRWTDGENDIDISTYDSPGYYNNPQLMAGDKGIIGCDEYWTLGPWEDEEARANGHLIAAAPDLLEALKLLLAADLYANGEGLYAIVNTDTDDGAVAVSKARAAIAKATTP